MNIRIKQQFWLLVFTLLTTGVAAQTNQFSLVEAQRFAMGNSYILKNTQHDVASAQKKVWETITTGLPQVSGTANYTKFLNLPVSLVPGQFFGEEEGTYVPVKFGQDYTSDFGFTVSQLIFDGSYIVGVGSSKIYLDLAKHANEKAEIDIREAVAQAYYLVLIGQKNLTVMQENLTNAQKLYSETKAYYDNGFREEMDVDQMRIIVKNAENEVLKAEREITIAKVVLKYTMGYDMDEDIELSDALDKFLMPLTAENHPGGFDFSAHIDYRLASTNILASEKLLKLEKAAFLPKLSGFYSYTKTAYGNHANLFKPGVSWYPSSLVGLQLEVPLFNSGQKIFKTQQARIELEKATNNRRLAETTLQKDYLTAVAEMRSAVEEYENDVENRKLAEKILDKSKIKFNNGLTSSTELSQLESQYIEAHGAYVASTLQILQADLKLQKAMGKL
ncbi:TolC family protein [Mariniphaga sediminis]|jgi:outer membrane protein TolC|uniref:TolC family protein n=1 Tax=Mariniphaga sediminis TaxID=1628158 RepID=A0A399CY50_9BACT|nr:TolC family protein [Mariniphaga sediminis]RIH64594.1 TolC family protein [Mariniphaga sediminis]